MQTRLSHSVPALAAIVALVVPIGADVVTSSDDPPSPVVDTTMLPDALAELTGRAVELFDDAGLDLPTLRFTHHGDDREHCGGWKGVHRYENGVSDIGLCTDDFGPTTEWLVLHETAHAWAAHSLTEERRAAFRSLRGWEEWRADVWHESGSEQAAEIIAWGLIDRPVGVVTIHEHGCDDLVAGYLVLTGREALHGHRDRC